MSKNLITLINGFKNEKEAVQFFIKSRWNGKITCPYKECESNIWEQECKIYELQSGHDYKCSCCGKTFSYKTGTIFENTKIELKKWFTAIYLHTANKKGISSCQLAKHLGITQKTAWFMLHRIRHAINTKGGMFSGTTEADETYIGGKEGNKHANKKNTKEKMTVLGIVNRDTKQAKITKVKSNEYHILGKEIIENVSEGSNLITDGFSAYETLGKIGYNHQSVNHSQGEYVKKNSKSAFKIHTNTIEGLFSHVKRTILGTYHFISEKHAQKYLNEISFRYNTRNEADYSRFAYFLGNTEVRLKYDVLIQNAN